MGNVEEQLRLDAPSGCTNPCTAEERRGLRLYHGWELQLQPNASCSAFFSHSNYTKSRALWGHGGWKCIKHSATLPEAAGVRCSRSGVDCVVRGERAGTEHTF
eukprot:EG_transcript_43203